MCFTKAATSGLRAPPREVDKSVALWASFSRTMTSEEVDLGRHTLRLVHPDGGGDVVVLGTAHISADAAAEAEALVRSLRPDVVVIELDAERYASLLRSAGQPGFAALDKGDSVVKLVGLISRGELPNFAGSVLSSVAGTLLHTQPGGEFAAAVAAANEVGSVVILGDRSFRVTMSRLKRRLRHAAQPSRGAGRPAGQPPSLAPLMKEAGCAPPEEVLQSARRLMRDAMRGGPVQPDDLGSVRHCFGRVVELTRDKALAEDSATGIMEIDLARSGLAPQAADAVYRTLVAERDLLLARSLQMRPGSVVGIVGAGHVRGIAREWATARSPEQYAIAQEYEQPWPCDVPRSFPWASMLTQSLVAGSGLLLAVRRPRLAVRLAGLSAGMTSVALAAAAQGVRQLKTALAAVERASKVNEIDSIV